MDDLEVLTKHSEATPMRVLRNALAGYFQGWRGVALAATGAPAHWPASGVTAPFAVTLP